jgi:uncharacterized protein
MKTAAEILHQHFEASNDIERWINLFADDGILESPHLKALGLPTRYEGKAAIRSLVEPLIRSTFFSFNNIHIFSLDRPNEIFAEYEAQGIIRTSGYLYRQSYVIHLVTQNGRIKIFREYVDLVPTVSTRYSSGLANLRSLVGDSDDQAVAAGLKGLRTEVEKRDDKRQ